MANVAVSDLAALTALGDDDLFMVTDDSEAASEKSKKITMVNVEKRFRPPGEVAAFMLTSAPPGWLACDGSAVSRTTYANLFTAISTVFGEGDGSLTFNVPDLRGYFLRGWDNGAGIDPDAASRTDRGDGTGGDVIGSIQQGEIESHTHGIAGSIQAFAGAYKRIPGAGSSIVSGSTGGNETRPVNINILYCIKT